MKSKSISKSKIRRAARLAEALNKKSKGGPLLETLPERLDPSIEEGVTDQFLFWCAQEIHRAIQELYDTALEGTSKEDIEGIANFRANLSRGANKDTEGFADFVKSLKGKDSPRQRGAHEGGNDGEVSEKTTPTKNKHRQNPEGHS
jgi:hypothetical protein